MRALGCLASALLPACAGELLPGELVLPGDLPVDTWRGEPGQRLGASLAEMEALLLAGAPGVGGVATLAAGEPAALTWAGSTGLGEWLFHAGGELYAGAQGQGLFHLGGEAGLTVEAPGALAFAGGDTFLGPRLVVVEAEGLLVLSPNLGSEERLPLEGARRAWVGDRRILATRCLDGECDVMAWPLDEPGWVALGSSGEGGDVCEVDGVAWWGDPQVHEHGAGGVVMSEDGTRLSGIPGDHVGKYIAGGWTAGVFNREQVPARLRVLSLDGETVLALDDLPPGRTARLAVGGGWLALGLPDAGSARTGEGVVMRLDLGLLP